MARGTTVVQIERLRDQVHRLIREDLKAGEFKPGDRLVEGDLADRYKVSRTPVREALFQLARDGLLMSGSDRGYIVAIDTPASTLYRHEVRDLLDPRLAFHAASEGTATQRKALQKAHERQCAAHKAGRITSFISANMELRETLRDMCQNKLLSQCSALVDAQANWARSNAFSNAQYRQVEIEADERLVAAIVACNAPAAEEAMRHYIEQVRHRLAKNAMAGPVELPNP